MHVAIEQTRDFQKRLVLGKGAIPLILTISSRGNTQLIGEVLGGFKSRRQPGRSQAPSELLSQS